MPQADPAPPVDPTPPADPTPPRESEVGAAEAALILLAGVVAGTINTVVGSGTLVTFPTLLFFGFAPVTANVSNTVGLVAGGLTGSWGYRHELGGGCGHPAAVGTDVPPRRGRGALLLLVLDPAAFKAIVPVLIGLGVLLVAFGPRLTAWSTRLDAATHPPPRSVSTPVDAPWCSPPASWRRRSTAATSAPPRGSSSWASSRPSPPSPLQSLNGIKNVLSTIVNAVAALTFVVVAPEQVDWAVAGLIAAGSLLGGVIGSRVGRRLPPNVLRAVIVVIGIVAIVRMVWAS